MDQQFRNVEKLRAESIEIRRKHKIALDNAFLDGYRAGQDDQLNPLSRSRK